MPDDKSHLIPMGDGTLFWSFQEDFGPYLRKLRKQKGMTLMEAAGLVNLSFTKLQKLERVDVSGDLRSLFSSTSRSSTTVPRMRCSRRQASSWRCRLTSMTD